MKTAVGNIVGAIVCALVGVTIWIATDLTIRGEGQGIFHTDARLFPHFIAFMITIVSMAWLASSIAGRRNAGIRDGEADDKAQPVEWGAYSRVALFIALFFAYAYAVRPMGFVLSSLLAGEAALALLKERRPLIYAVVGGCVLLLYVVFQYILKVRLP